MMSAPVALDGVRLAIGASKKRFEVPPARRYARSLRTFDVSAGGGRFPFARSSQSEMENRRIQVAVNWFEELKATAPPGVHP
jgi:hypothetical protein